MLPFWSSWYWLLSCLVWVAEVSLFKVYWKWRSQIYQFKTPCFWHWVQMVCIVLLIVGKIMGILLFRQGKSWKSQRNFYLQWKTLWWYSHWSQVTVDIDLTFSVPLFPRNNTDHNKLISAMWLSNMCVFNEWMLVGEGMAGSLYWHDLISLVQEIGFSTPYLVAASHIEVHNCDLKKKAGNLCSA